MDFRQILADLKAAGLTQTDVAQRCGCSQNHISDIFRGITPVPRWDIGDALLRVHRESSAPSVSQG